MLRRLRILVVTDRYPPHYTGGYEIACYAVSERLRQHGQDVAVLTSNYGLKGRTKREGYVHRLLHRPQDSASLLQLARWEINDNETLRRLVRNWKPDVISAWSMLQLFPSLHVVLGKAGVPVVFNVHDLWFPTHLAAAERWQATWSCPGSNLVKHVAKTIIRTFLQWRHPDWLRPITANDVALRHVVFCSRFRQAQHVKVGLPLGKSQVVYNGIDLNLFHGIPSSASERHVRVLFVGRLVREKGAHTAIQAVGELLRRGYCQVQLDIVGVPAFPFDYATELRVLIDQHRLQERVRFLGMLANQDMPSVFQQHDILVFPSIGDEGFPMTLLEAMSCGVAVAGTTTGGSAEILEDSVNCLTFPPDDAVSLADCLARFINNPELAQTLASAGQTLVREKFDLEKITDQTETYLQAVVQEGKVG